MTKDNPKNYFSMFGGQLGAERDVSRYQARDDASHIYHNEKEYYEWWYIDAAFENGYHFAATLHYRNGFFRPMISTLQFFIYKPDGTKIERYEMVDPADATASPEYCDVRMGESWLKDMDDHYDVNLKSGTFGARLKLQKNSPSWKPGEGLLYHNKENSNCFGWVVPVPYGSIEGELYLKDETVKVKGHGYHDHNWGNCHIEELFENWYWGRIHDGIYCIDYGWVKPRNPEMPIIAPLLIATQDKILLSTNMLQAELMEEKVDEVFGRKYANRLLLTAEAEGVSARIDIDSKRIAERLKMPEVAEWEQHYYRFIADFVMEIEVDGKKTQSKGEMLHEFVLL